MYKIFNFDDWPRRATYAFFKNYDDPFFNITGTVDVSALNHWCKLTKNSFFLSSLHAATRAANALEAFRLRLLVDHLVCYDQVHAGSTVLLPDNTFQFCYFDYTDDRADFIREGRQRIERLRKNPQLDPRDEMLDIIHFSIIPWVSFTSFKHARRWGMADTVPKIVFGKYFEQNGRLLMPLSVEVNHAMMDGCHVGLFFEKMQEILDRG